MTRIDQGFKRLKAKGEKALIPFITAGDPDLATTRALALEMAARGADLLELGIPFSDPLADGPTIQAASGRAMQGGVHLEDVLDLAGELRRETDIPLILMGYYNPILQYGLERTAAEEAAEQGVDGFIIPDLPPEEAGPWRVAAGQGGGSHHFPGRAHQRPGAHQDTWAASPRDFSTMSRSPGSPGPGPSCPRNWSRRLKEVRSLVKCPLAVGFGISTPEQVARSGPLRGRGGGGQRHRPAGGQAQRDLNSSKRWGTLSPRSKRLLKGSPAIKLCTSCQQCLRVRTLSLS